MVRRVQQKPSVAQIFAVAGIIKLDPFFCGDQTIRIYGGNLRDFAYNNGILCVGYPIMTPVLVGQVCDLTRKDRTCPGNFLGLQLDC